MFDTYLLLHKIYARLHPDHPCCIAAIDHIPILTPKVAQYRKRQTNQTDCEPCLPTGNILFHPRHKPTDNIARFLIYHPLIQNKTKQQNKPARRKQKADTNKSTAEE
jgi:hypothetical protein